MTLWRVSGELLLFLKWKNKCQTLAASYSSAQTGKRGRVWAAQRTSQPVPPHKQFRLPRRDWISFPCSHSADWVPSIIPILQWKTEAQKEQFFCCPDKSEGRTGFLTRIQFSHLSSRSATVLPRNITSDHPPLMGSQELDFALQEAVLGTWVG